MELSVQQLSIVESNSGMHRTRLAAEVAIDALANWKGKIMIVLDIECHWRSMVNL